MLLGIGALAAVTGIGSTLAANISLNGGGNVEFGQGVATTAACDGDITLTPVSTFENTAEDPTFAMTAIQVSDIDFTPEGWNDQTGTWNTNFDRETRTWSGEDSNRSGQYINVEGDWTNTCENKVLMLRAYTDNYAGNTVDNSIESPLYLTGLNGDRPAFGAGTNTGVAFKFVQDFADNDPTIGMRTDWVDESNNYDSDPIYLDSAVIDFEDSSLTIYLDDDLNTNPPLDSRWVDKLTIESAAELPGSWIDNS
jgi:hypothetical protein